MGKFAVIAITLSTFGPYLVGGVRWEQAVVYLLATVAVVFAAPFIRPWGGLRFLIPWVLMLAVALLGEAFPLRSSARWDGGGLLAGVDNLLLPLAVMVSVWCFVKPPQAESLLNLAGKLYVGGMTLNAGLAILDTRYDLAGYLRPFWTREDAMSAVAIRAGEMGRLSGIINQPSAAGLAYSLAGLLAVYLYMGKRRKLYLLLAIITIGGVLTVSKVFLLVGAPLILIYLWKSIQRKAGLMFAFILAAAGVIQYGIFQRWEGVDMLTRLLDPPPGQSLIGFYTAGRWVEGSPMMQVILEALRVSPLSGVGAGGWAIPYDSAWTQAIVVAGLLGAACLAAVLLGFFRLAKTTTDPERRRFTWFFALLLFGASFGVPALTTNRVGVIVWLVASLLVVSRSSIPESSETRTTAPSRSYPLMTSRRSLRR